MKRRPANIWLISVEWVQPGQHFAVAFSLKGVCAMAQDLNANLDNGVLEAEQLVLPSGNQAAEGTPQAVVPTAVQERLSPKPALPKPKRKVDLSTAQLPGLGKLQAVETLTIRERKGVGATFTPNIADALMFHGMVYKPQGEFETKHQIVAGALLTDPRIVNRASRIAFVPALDWSEVSVVLMPLKLNTYGQRVLADLQKLQPLFPHYKAFIQWVESKRRHVVYFDDLSENEKSVIEKVKWPTQEQMLDALSAAAYDNIDDLAAANEEVRALLQSQEVD
jgi:hypothetical protein